MNFRQFLEKYFLESKQQKLISTMKDLSVFTDLESIINRQFKIFYGEDINEIRASLAITTFKYVETINQKLEKITTNKSEIENDFIELSIYLIKDFFRSSNLDKKSFTEIIKYSLKLIYTEHSWNFSLIENLLDIGNLTKKGKIPASTSKILYPKKTFFIWKSEVNTDFFIDDVARTFKGLKNKSSLHKLFDRINDDFKIYIHPKHLLSFISLFYELYNSRIIVCSGSKGIWIYLENHLSPLPLDFFPKRPFRKLRNELYDNEQKKEEAFCLIKPLLDKYCQKDNRTIAGQ